jgi:acyl carrier protein
MDEQGEFHLEPGMDEQAIYNTLSRLFRETFEDAALVVHPATSADDIDGWDSYRNVELLMAAQEAFGITFTSREVDNMQSVGDLAASIHRHLAGPG